MADVKLNFDIETKEAIKDLAKLTKATTVSSKKIVESAKKSSAAWDSFKGNLGAKAIVGGFKSVSRAVRNSSRAIIDAASVQEDAINSLNTSLKITGQFTEQASKEFQEYASSLQSVTTVGDEAILQNAALIQSLGNLSQEGLQEATTAALDLSAALGLDLTSAAQLVGKAAAGNVTALSRYGITIKKTGDDAKDFQTALKKINDQFAGSATSKVKTYSGATQQAANSFGDLLEEVGFFITKNPLVIKTINEFSKAFQSVGDSIKANKSLLSGFINLSIKGFLILIKGLAEISVAADKISKALGFDEGHRQLKANQEIVERYTDKIKELKKVVADGTGFFANDKDIKKATKSLKVYEGLLDKANQRTVELVDAGAAANFGEGLIKGIEELTEQLDASEESAKKVVSEVKKIKQAVTDGKPILTDKQIKDLESAREKWLKSFGQGFIGEIAQKFPAIADGMARIFGEKLAPEIAKAAGNILSSLSGSIVTGTRATRSGLDEIKAIEKEAAIAKANNELFEYDKLIQKKIEAEERLAKEQGKVANNFLGDVANSIVSIWSPALGGLIEDIINISTDPEAATAFIESFVDSLPELITAIIEAIPGITQAIILAIPPVIEALVQGIFTSLEVHVEAFRNAITHLANEFGKILEQMFQKFGEGFSNLGKSLSNFAKSFPQAAKDFLKGLVDGIGSFIERLVQGIIDGVKEGLKIDDGGPKIGGALGQIGEGLKGGLQGIGSAFGFADGVIVPPGFPNDTLEARLTSGEEVVSISDRSTIKSDIERLSSLVLQMASNQGDGKTIQVQLVMNESVLAEQILELNRDNARLQA